MDDASELLLQTIRDSIASHLEKAADDPEVAQMSGPAALRMLAAALRQAHELGLRA